jgi:rhodanese-related sulfurtransferase
MKWMQFFTPAMSLDADEARAYIKTHKQGTYTLLDVRQPSEYEKSHIPGAVLIPLPELLNRHRELNPEKPVIAY